VATLRPGQLFGERALRDPDDSENSTGSWNLIMQRSANVLSLSRCELLELDQARFDSIRDRHPEVVAALNPGILVGLGLSKEVKIDLFQSGKGRVLDQGAFVFNEGDDATCVFIVISGVLSVVALVGGCREEVALLKEGQLFGERALRVSTDEKPRRSAGVRAVSSCRLLEIPHDSFCKLQGTHPSLQQALSIHSYDHSEYDEEQALRRLHGHLLCYPWTDPTGLLPVPPDEGGTMQGDESLEQPVGIFCSAAGVQLLDVSGLDSQELDPPGGGAGEEGDKSRAARIKVFLSYSWDRVGEVRAKEQAVVAEDMASTVHEDALEDLMELFEFHVDQVGGYICCTLCGYICSVLCGHICCTLCGHICYTLCTEHCASCTIHCTLYTRWAHSLSSATMRGI
jgi:CRP-like cAMP-binding protein